MKIALIGYGKMGKAIEALIREQFPDMEIALCVGAENLGDLTSANLKLCDVAIEFTQPDAAVRNILKCFEAGVPVVVGTTAWLEQLPVVLDRCSAMQGGLFFSPNYSIGVNIFWEVNRKLAELMNRQPQYDVDMVEIHHTEKKDAPSGTAVKTAEVILETLSSKKHWKLADGTPAANDELLIVAKREPDVPGTHTVTYTSAVDFIQITHEAKSRRGFAEGAVLAARWMIGKKGVFGMKDLLAL